MADESRSIMPRKKEYLLMFTYIGLFVVFVRLAFYTVVRRDNYEPTTWIILLMVFIALAILFAALAQIEYLKEK